MVDGTDVCLGLLVNTKRIEKTVCHRELCHVNGNCKGKLKRHNGI